MKITVSALISALLVICIMLTTGCVSINIYGGGEGSKESGKPEVTTTVAESEAEPTEATEPEEVTETEEAEAENTPTNQLWAEYSKMKDGSWKLPGLEDLLDTTWAIKETADNGDLHSYEVTFRGGGADVRWNNDGEDHEYIAAFYMLTYDEGVAIIELDLGGLTEIQKFAVLMSTGGDFLYTCANVVEGETLLCGSSVSSRTLEKAYE